MLEITFVTDFVCPYCLVGKAALEKAMETSGIEAQIKIQPMELTEEPKPRVDTYNDPVRRANYKVLDKPAKDLGLDMKIPLNVIPRPYTRLAWEGWFFAKEHGLGDLYSDLMYRAYFIDEKDIGDIEVLVKLAESIGLDGTEYRNVLNNGTYYKEQRMASDYSRHTLEVKGIPTLFINGQRVKMSDYSIEAAVELLKHPPTSESETTFGGCDPDGCCGPASLNTPPEDGCGPDGCHY